MFLILKHTVNLYFYLNDEISDPRARDKLFMANPFSMFGILAAYLMFVLKWGPAYMKNRRPYNLDWIIAIYNVVQIVACADLVRMCLTHAYIPGGYDLLCEPVDYSMSKLGLIALEGSHTYFLLKVLDLLDTVFFVLRKKDRQISFLHLYHHTGMVVLTWNATKFLPGGHGVFTGFINSIIHVIMYTYYLLALISPKYKNNLWWKKYITQMQMIQFFLIIVHWLLILFQPECKFPKFTIAVMVPQNMFMLVLFGDFYRKAYMAKNGSTQAPVTDNDQDLETAKIANRGVRKRTSRLSGKDTAEFEPPTEQAAGENEASVGLEYNKKRMPDKTTVNGNYLQDIHYE